MDRRFQTAKPGGFELVSAMWRTTASDENVGVDVSDDRRRTQPQHAKPSGGGGAVKHRSPLITLAAVAVAFAIMFIVNMLSSPPGNSSTGIAGPAATPQPAVAAPTTGPDL